MSGWLTRQYAKLLFDTLLSNQHALLVAGTFTPHLEEEVSGLLEITERIHAQARERRLLSWTPDEIEMLM